MMKLIYTFGCPECRKIFRTDEPGEPCCTGPSEMRDDHPHIVMELLCINKVEVNPAIAAQRAVGRLLMPHEDEAIRQDVRILTSTGQHYHG